MQVVVWPAVGLFCKLEVLQEAISLVITLRCKLQEKIASYDMALRPQLHERFSHDDMYEK